MFIKIHAETMLSYTVKPAIYVQKHAGCISLPINLNLKLHQNLAGNNRMTIKKDMKTVHYNLSNSRDYILNIVDIFN